MAKPLTITLSSEMEKILPLSVRRQAGFKTGDTVEIKAIGGIVTLISSPSSAEEPREGRSDLLAEIKEARKGPHYGPFQTAQEFAAFLKIYKSSRKEPRPKHKRVR